MAARDRWESNYTCPSCMATGTIKWSEEDHPWVRGDSRWADHISGPFEVRKLKPFDHQVWCKNCQVQVSS